MNLTRCSNGHFYDQEKYSACPHCGGSIGEEGVTAAFINEDTPTAPLSQDMPSATPAADIPRDADTMGVGVNNAFAGESVTVPLSLGGGQNMGPGFGQVNNFPSFGVADSPTEPLNEGQPDMPTEPLDDDKTMAFDFGFDAVKDTEVKASTAAKQTAEKAMKNEPCVGWLVAIGGNNIGRDFRLKAGKNFIGRDESMDVVLRGDKTVSHIKHAIVVYEPKQHLYLIQPGEASTLVYKNNEVVLSPVTLEAYDLITVGEVNLLFMPLCNKNFNWTEVASELKTK